MALPLIAGLLLVRGQGVTSTVLPPSAADPNAPPVTSTTFTAPAPGLLDISAATTDASGNLYLAGRTSVSGLTGSKPAFQATPRGQDAFVLKLDPGGRVLWVSYLGGNDRRSASRHFPGDVAMAISVDPQEQPVVGGVTCSTDFPTVNAILQSPVAANGCDGFVAKFSADGQRLLFSTYLGGPDASAAVSDLATGPAGETWLALTSTSRQIATHNDLSGGAGTLVVVKLNPAGGVTWSTRLPSRGPLAAPVREALTVDAAGDVYVAVGPSVGGSTVTRLDASGRRIVYDVWLRGDARASQVAITADRHLVVTGTTLGQLLDVSSAWQAAPGGGWDGFFARITPSGEVASLSYLGGPGWEASGGEVKAIAMAAGGVLVGLDARIRGTAGVQAVDAATP